MACGEADTNNVSALNWELAPGNWYLKVILRKAC
jgi:hypothetical protein